MGDRSVRQISFKGWSEDSVDRLCVALPGRKLAAIPVGEQFESAVSEAPYCLRTVKMDTKEYTGKLISLGRYPYE